MQSRDYVYCSVPRVVFYLSSGYMREPSHVLAQVDLHMQRNSNFLLKVSHGFLQKNPPKILVSLVLKSLKKQTKRNWSSYLINCVKFICKIRIVNKKYILKRYN